MDARPEVTVIIPTYNRSALVQSAIRSVLDQTREVEEIIVVDDGSTDSTCDTLQRVFGGRLRLERKPNGGVSSARNLGLRLARGKYIAFIDSDDEWLPDKNRLQVEWLEAHPDFGQVLCDVVRVDSAGRQIDVFRRRDFIPEDGLILKWVLAKPNWVPSSAVIRREVYEQVGEFDETLMTGEDLDFNLRIASSWKIGVVSEPLVRARRHHDGLSRLKRTLDDYLRVIESAAHNAGNVISTDDKNRALARAYAMAARERVYAGEWDSAWAMWQKAWAMEPDCAHRLKTMELIPLAIRRIASALRHRGQPRA